MFSQPNLSQSKQPNVHYDYDGLSGGWLWFPWWVHIGVAILAWPLSWWVLPALPFQNASISDFLLNYKLQIASAISILTIMTAFLSYLKAYRIQKRKRSVQIISKAKKATSATSKKMKRNEDAQAPVAHSKVKRATKPTKKETQKTTTNTRKTTSKANTIKNEKKSVARKKGTVKKRNEQQTQLDLS